MIRSNSLFLIVLFLFVSFDSLNAQIEWSGFMDILHNNDLENSSSSFSYGQFEIDLAMPAGDNITVEAAVAYNPDGEKMEMGAGLIEFAIENSPAPMSIVIGQFDVPFGMDFLFIPSPDRPLVSTPLMNRKGIDSWNDIGVTLNFGFSFADLSLYTVNGLGNDYSYGTRLDITALQGTNFGFSYSAELPGNDDTADLDYSVLGLHTAAGISIFEIMGEYHILSDLYEAEVQESTANAWYLQLKARLSEHSLLPDYALARIGGWDEDNGGNADELSVGAAWNFSPSASFRVEYGMEKDDKDTADRILTAQIAVSF